MTVTEGCAGPPIPYIHVLPRAAPSKTPLFSRRPACERRQHNIANEGPKHTEPVPDTPRRIICQVVLGVDKAKPGLTRQSNQLDVQGIYNACTIGLMLGWPHDGRFT